MFGTDFEFLYSESNNGIMNDRITNVIALAKHKNLVHKRALICRYIRMKYSLKITPVELGYRLDFLKEVCIYDSL